MGIEPATPVLNTSVLDHRGGLLKSLLSINYDKIHLSIPHIIKW